jgi:hypothetical protein
MRGGVLDFWLGRGRGLEARRPVVVGALAVTVTATGGGRGGRNRESR